MFYIFIYVYLTFSIRSLLKGYRS